VAIAQRSRELELCTASLVLSLALA